MSQSPKSEAQKSTTNERLSNTDDHPTRYQFANNPVMRRSWMRNLLFGLGIAMPLSLVGLQAGLWEGKDLLLIYGVVVVTCMLLLPLYATIVRELG